MKKTIFILIALMIITIINPISAQQTDKELTKKLKTKAIRAARKEAKQYKKDGYYNVPGSPPLDMQLERSWKYYYMTDEDGSPAYMTATGIAVGETHFAASIAAREMAKLTIAGAATSKVAEIINTNVANNPLNTEDAISVTKVVAAAKTLVAERLTSLETLVEMHKKIGKNVEINIVLAFSSKVAKEIANNVIRKSLEEETNLLQGDIDKLMKFKR